MFIICAITTLVLAVMLVISAALKLRRHPEALHVIHEVVGVPLRLFPVLAAIQLAGAVGVVAGLWVAPLGVAAAVGVILYFVGAVGAHVRVGDLKGLWSPLVPLAVAVVVPVFRTATA